MSLSSQEIRFIEEYVATRKLRQSMEKCGLHTDAPKKLLRKMLTKPAFAKAYANAVETVNLERDVTNDVLDQEYARIAFCDPGIFYDNAGNLIPIHLLPPEARMLVKGIKFMKVKVDRDNEQIIPVCYEMHDKLTALQKLGESSKRKYFTQQIEVNHSGGVEFRPYNELVSRLVDLVRKAGAGVHNNRIEEAGEAAKIIELLPEYGFVQKGTLPEAS